MIGLCLDKVTGTFPSISLKSLENDIKEYHRSHTPCGELPQLPDMVGGETDIIVGIKYLKYFPKEIFKLPSGLTMYESMFRNENGSLGVVAGPHPSIENGWDTMGYNGASHLLPCSHSG